MTRAAGEGQTHFLFAADVPPAPPVGRWIAFGLLTAVLMFGGFGSWAALAPLASASLASGTVKVDSNRKTVQHYEGGIIREILVRDGDHVREGQVLLRLDDLEARADLDGLQGQLDALRAREARLIAQRDGHASIGFPNELLERHDEPDVHMILEGQRRILADHARALSAEIAVWHQRREQHRAQIASLEAESRALADQLASLREEHEAAAQLLARGFERRPRVLELQRRVQAAHGEIDALASRIKALHEQIVEADLQVTALREGRARAVSEELREVQTAVAEFKQRIEKAEALTGRRQIVAPQEGTVVNLRFFTAGGVIAPGAEVLEIVPSEDKLNIEARVRPLDIDVVRPGLSANVRLLAFKHRITPTLKAAVTRVSADALSDPRTGEIYFLATVEVSADELARVPHVELYPGMPAEVAVVSGERTLATYLLQPLFDGFARAFREE